MLKIVSSPYLQPVPKLQVSPTFEWCSDRVRAEMNTYLKERFGTVETAIMIDGQALGLTFPFMKPERKRASQIFDCPALVVNPEMAAMIKLFSI